MLRGVLALALSGLALSSPPQIPRDNSAQQTGTSVIRGRVVSAATGEPLRKARVTLLVNIPAVFTDNEGRFAFTNLPAGRYTVSARKTGYATTIYGAAQAGSPPIAVEVASRATVDGIEIRMPKGAAISGHVIDQFGDPIERAFVTAQRLTRAGGLPNLVTQAATMTDDLGEYRLGGLPAGSFIISARVPVTGGPLLSVTAPDGNFQMASVTIVGGVSTMTFAGPRGATYYPGGPSLSRAQPITVHPGDEAASIDFTALPTSPATVSVTLLDPGGNPVGGMAAIAREGDPSLTGEGRAMPVRPPATAVTLEPGEWVMFAKGKEGAATRRFTAAPGDMSIAVTLAKGARVGGRIVVDGVAASRPGLVVEANPTDVQVNPSSLGDTGNVKPDGTFEIPDVLGRRTLRLQSVPPGMAVTAIQSGERSLLDSPIEFQPGLDLLNVQFALTSHPPVLSGTAAGASGVPVKDFTVLIFRGDDSLPPSRALARRARPNQNGTFQLDDLAPGAYVIAAVADVDEASAASAEYLGAVRARGVPVRLAERERRTIVLDVVSAR